MVADNDHCDITEVSGLKLPKDILKTEWSTGAGTVGMDPWTVPLSAYVYMPKSSDILRSIANGKFTILESARSVDEHRSIDCLMKKVRGQDSDMRLPILAKQIAKEMNVNLNGAQAKKVVLQQVAIMVNDALAQMQGNPSTVEMSVLIKRLDDMGTQLSIITAENVKLKAERQHL